MTKKKKGNKKLSSQELQIHILRFLLAHAKKQYNARQIIDHLALENSKDSVDHALNMLAQAGSVMNFKDTKYGVALSRLTVDNEETEIVAPVPAPAAPAKTKRSKADRNAAVKGTDEAEIDEMPETAAFVAAPKPESRRAEPPRAKKRDVESRKVVEGRIDMTRTGAAYLVSELLDSDVYIAARFVNGALHGDTVKVALFQAHPRRRNVPERKPEGEVIEVTKRAKDHFIGTLRKSRKYALFLPDNPSMPTDIYVGLEDTMHAQDGDKVVVMVTDWQDGKNRVPIGIVTSVLGAVGGNDFEMKKILINQGFELEHTPESLQEAEKVPEHISDQEIARRRDFRDVLTFTIDPEDAKDFDDALSFKELEDGNMEIGVHIADVTHYLKPDSPMDKEAFKRSTSVYLVDRVNPMLPEKLSNNVCSLVPHQDRLTFSAVFVFDNKGKIHSRWFGKTVIHSAKRFSYEEAQTVLEGKPAESVSSLDIFPQLEYALKKMHGLSKIMRKEREKNGAIGFETEEVRFRLEMDGTPIEAYVKERKEAHLLIEDYMLLANKEVALYMDLKAQSMQEIPFVYRVHDLPDMERVAEFSRFALELGYKMKVDTPKQIAASYNGLMKATQKDERLKLLEPLAIRTMAKAIYTTQNIGHYGLGFTHYTHFTSPIRRYSDVLAHRLLERNLDGKVYRVDKSKLEEQCKHISAMERRAADAERESIKYKQAELTQRQIGKTFEGVISGMIERGFFVELPGSKAEGMVAFKDLNDTYAYQSGQLSVKGRRWGREFKMGDHVNVRVVGVDLQKRQIELDLVE